VAGLALGSETLFGRARCEGWFALGSAREGFLLLEGCVTLSDSSPAMCRRSSEAVFCWRAALALKAAFFSVSERKAFEPNSHHCRSS